MGLSDKMFTALRLITLVISSDIPSGSPRTAKSKIAFLWWSTREVYVGAAG